MATLTNTKVKDTYQTLLKLTSGTIGGGFTVVQDGNANDSGLSISSGGIGVGGLTFTTSPAVDNTEATGLFLNSSGVVVQRDFAGSAFATPTINGGTGITVGGGFPTYTVTNSAPDQTVAITGVDIAVSGAYPNFTLTNSAPDQVVSITGTGAATVTGTYPNFTVDADTGVHEEMFVGVLETSYTLGGGASQVLSFSAPNNTNETSSYHFGKAPAQLSLPTPENILNSSGGSRIIYIDMAAYIDVQSPNSDITYKLETNSGTGWTTKQSALRTKGTAGLHVDSFWGIFIVADGEQMRIVVESQSGNVIVTPMTQIKFEVKETGNII